MSHRKDNIGQSQSHAAILTYVDDITGQRLRSGVQRIRTDFYPKVIFPQVQRGNIDRQDKPGPRIHQAYATERARAMISIGCSEKGHIDYSGYVAPNKAAVDLVMRGKPITKEFDKRLRAITWFTLEDGQRRVMQDILGGILLATLGEEVGEPDLPAVSGRKRITTNDKNLRLYSYEPVEQHTEQSPYVLFERHGAFKEVSRFIGFMAANDEAAIEKSTNHEEGGYATNETSGLDLSLLRPPAFMESYAGKMVARAVLVPNLLPTQDPIETLLA